MIRWVPLVALALLLAGCAGGAPPADGPAASTPPASPGPSPSAGSATVAPKTLTPADDGSTFTMTVGRTTTLRLADPDEPEPEVEGSAVLLIRSVNVGASDAREWEVRAVEPGTATLRGGDWSVELIVQD